MLWVSTRTNLQQRRTGNYHYQIIKERNVVVMQKNVHFNYKQNIYTETDGVGMSFPIDAVIAGIFMVNLERS